MPRVSIITPAFNVAEYIEAAIGSALSQTFGDFEYIIVDDGSSDETLSIANKFSEIDSRIRVFSCSQNMGAAAARNVGLKYAIGELITFLDADDTWQQSFLSEMVTFIDEQSSDCRGVFCWSEVANKYGEGQLSNHPRAGRYNLFRYMLKMAPNGNGSSLLFKRDAIIRAGEFRNHPVGHDTEFFMETIAKDPAHHLVCLPKSLVVYLRRLDSLTQGSANLRIASYEYRLNRYLPLLPKGDRLIASYSYLKKAMDLGDFEWASRWARKLLSESRVGVFEKMRPHQFLAVCFIAASSNRFSAFAVRGMQSLLKKIFSIFQDKSTNALTFEMQGFSIGNTKGQNPYPLLLGSALTKVGVHSVRSGRSPDVWHIHWLHQYLFVRSRLTFSYKMKWKSACKLILRLVSRKIRRRKNVLTVHNLHSHEEPFPRFEKIVSRICISLMDNLIVHSESAKLKLSLYYRRIPAKKIHIVPHPNFVGYYPDNITRSEARTKLNIGSESLVFLSFGMIRAYKGIAELVQAFKRFNDPTARLVIAGEAHGTHALSASLMQEIHSDSRIICVTEFIADDDVQIYFRAADIAVVTYRNILTSGSIPLAQSFGLPCIAPDFPSIREQIGEHKGILYDQFKEDALLDALLFASSERVTLGERGRAHLKAALRMGWIDAAAIISRIYSQTHSFNLKPIN